MVHHVGRCRPRQRAHDAQGAAFPAFARAALFGLHLLHRVQGQFRRVQGDGARALWRAEIQVGDPRSSDRPQGRRHVPPRSRLFRLLHRPHHDQCALRRAVRRAGARPEEGSAHAAPHGCRGLDAGGDRGGGPAADALARARDTASTISASPAASRSTASPTARCCATARSSNIWIQPAAGDAGGAVGAALAAWHQFLGQRRAAPTACIDAMDGAYLGPGFEQNDVEQRLAKAGARFSVVSDEELDRGHRRRRSPTARRSAGSRAAWSSVRARSATARSSATRARRRCRSSSTAGQVSRELPAVRARGAARGRGGLVRARRRLALHAARRRRATATAAGA